MYLNIIADCLLPIYKYANHFNIKFRKRQRNKIENKNMRI